MLFQEEPLTSTEDGLLEKVLLKKIAVLDHVVS